MDRLKQLESTGCFDGKGCSNDIWDLRNGTFSTMPHSSEYAKISESDEERLSYLDSAEQIYPLIVIEADCWIESFLTCRIESF